MLFSTALSARITKPDLSHEILTGEGEPPRTAAMDPLDLVRLRRLMERTSGIPEIVVGLIDGPVALDHPDLVGRHIEQVRGGGSATCSRAASLACSHGTFVAGILSRRGTVVRLRRQFVPGAHSWSDRFSPKTYLEMVSCRARGPRS